MTEDEETDVGFLVQGRVQGVGFRWWTRRAGEELGLSGSVRNLRDGSVEVRVRGPRERVEELRRRLTEGPPSSRVETVSETTSSLPIRAGTFTIER